MLRRSYAPIRGGVYFVSGQSLSPRDLKLADASGVKQIYHFERALSEGLAVSPDGLTLFFGQLEQDGTELMLVENFWR